MRENIWKNIKLGFKTNKLAVAGAVAILLLALISIFAFLYPVDPNAISATERLNAPSMAMLWLLRLWRRLAIFWEAHLPCLHV